VEEQRRASLGPFEDLEVIRQQAAVSTWRFCRLIQTPERTRSGMPVNGPWPTPAQDSIEAFAVAKAKAWPAWGIAR